MKFVMKWSALAFGILMLVSAANAQSPREQLRQMVEQLQGNPGDDALRERIIKLAQEVKPAPAIPEEANRAFVRGNIFQKEAKDQGGYDLAISSYQAALRHVPWWADAYYNLAVAQELAKKFDDAIATLRLFILAAPSVNDAREAQNRIYAIEAKKELAHVAEQAAKAPPPTPPSPLAKFKGVWKLSGSNWMSVSEVPGKEWKVQAQDEDAEVLEVDSHRLRVRRSFQGRGGYEVKNIYLLSLTGENTARTEYWQVCPPGTCVDRYQTFEVFRVPQ